MSSEYQVLIQCDQCEETIVLDVSVNNGTVDLTKLQEDLKNEGWEWLEADRHLCPNHSNP
jgi:hypothetical protein